jgi:anti-sigma factor RsiW
VKPGDGRHLSDDQMIAVYVGAEPRFGRRNRTLDHLQGCSHCVRRYQGFVQQMADQRDEAIDEADAVFTPARLEAQRQQILARLDHAAHPARVIPFPSHSSPNLSILTWTQVRRWIAVAAAAAFIIGLTLGRTFDIVAPPHNDRVRVTIPVSGSDPAVTPGPATSVANEEEILSRVEQTQGELQVPAELEALGGITPIRDVALKLPPRR